MTPRLVLFDADGTLRRCTVPGQVCPNREGEWELLPGVRERIAALAADGARFAIASNQGGVAAGHLSAATARALLEALAAAAFPDPSAVRVLLCVHPTRAGCACRKPRPGMLQEALRWARVAAPDALLVGDSDSDQGAAQAAGVAFAWAWDFFGFESPQRPVPAQRAHDLAQHRAILAELLEIERARLREALRIERERSMVFPETTVIVKDVQKLAAAVYGPAAVAAEGEQGAPAGADGGGANGGEGAGPECPPEDPAEGGESEGGEDVDAILAGLAAGAGGRFR